MSPTRSRRRVLPTADLLGPGSAVVVLGLASAISWGAGDFGGGWLSRRAPVLGVSLVVQLVGILVAGSIAALVGEAMPGPGSIAIAVAAGVTGVLGILALYNGLAVGRMGVVAPVTGVIAASLPVGVGILRDGVPDATVVVGIVLALVAVVLVSRVPGAAGSRSGVEFGIGAGLGIGLFNILVAGLPQGEVFGPLAIFKVTSAVVIGLIVVFGRRPWQVPRGSMPLALGIGVADMGGNGLYVLATQAGRLDIAATLSSLYPVTTVLLAILLLGERLSRSHAAGILAAGAAIALITSGTRG